MVKVRSIVEIHNKAKSLRKGARWALGSHHARRARPMKVTMRWEGCARRELLTHLDMAVCAVLKSRHGRDLGPRTRGASLSGTRVHGTHAKGLRLRAAYGSQGPL